MTDYDADHDGDQTPEHVEYIELWGTGENQGLLRFAIWVAAIAVAGWFITQLLLN